MAGGAPILVGLDFGTTFSGIAWAFDGPDDEIEVISTWPGGGNKTSPKVPSVLSYDGLNINWGYQVHPFAEAFQGIKLLLDESQEIKYAPSLASGALLKKYKKDAVQVTADYLNRLVSHAKSILQRRFDIGPHDMNLRFVLTVPATWSDKAKDKTLSAAIKASIQPQDVSLISEPEAAALYALRAIQPNSVSRNDVFIVCDAGGGTVDLISYQIKTLEPLVLAEVSEGIGRICGSMLLDHRFERLLRDRIGPDQYASLKPKSKEAARTYWQDRVKPNYVGKYDEDYGEIDYFIPLPGASDDPTVPIEDGFFHLSSDDVERIFDPIVCDVEELIAGQVASITRVGLSIEAIILVGGFGSSEYLFRRVQKQYPTIKVLQPPDAWSAVVRYKSSHIKTMTVFANELSSGAVQRGLEGNRVECRIARRNYGVEFRTDWNPITHGAQNRIWDRLEERYLGHQMRWYIKKVPLASHTRRLQSSEIREDQPIKMDFYRTIEVRNAKTDMSGTVTLYFYNDGNPPDVRNSRILQLCVLEYDLSQIPQQLFERKRNSKGVDYFVVPYKLVMTPTSASLLFELEFEGLSYGSVRSKY
ncbi:hypothetical protein KXV74_004355 [Aspergillus fumigatus]|uniref:Hsp70 family chaperone n=1 Tax=Aspergillus fumigatus TaxID=746128 RepID=A0A9P8N9L1_ASPFM|nr:hypothetical protein KXX31_004199 [Aspergillus fumigatus]KAH1893490.1 hypothetical protein KXV57_002905 [Aspergillus fumigatus]KAH2166233.1 hypothetical protein KXV74_004355 [Aspergillus fumigatus]KAH2462705.1 hypothetical protein KXV71_004489 [Aspergillus fumigatus]KAH2888656.1 hypothetical protein KXV75_004560 [Aspergillus fumigatus]